MKPYIFLCLNFVLPKNFGLVMPLTPQEFREPGTAGEAVQIGGGRLLGAGDAAGRESGSRGNWRNTD